MNEEYFKRPEPEISSVCPAHFEIRLGAFTPDGVWVGYIKVMVCGDIAKTYKILGHAGHLRQASFMLLLWTALVRRLYERHAHVGRLMYHMWDVGTDGLRQWKHRVGLRPTRIAWREIYDLVYGEHMPGDK